MDPNTQRSESRYAGADAYWRRRFFALVAGLGVVGLLVWAVTGIAGGGSSSGSSGNNQSGPGQMSAAGYGRTATPLTSVTVPAGPASTTPPAAAATTPAASPSASPAKGAEAAAPRSSTTVTPTATPSPAHSTRSAKAAGPVACPAFDVVLTVTASQASYGPKQQPSFRIDVVSTDTAPCAFDVGPKALRVVVSHGSTVAWNSGDCQARLASHLIYLRRGVPVVTGASWDRQLTAGGCSTTVVAKPDRTYTATAQSTGVHSTGTSFRLK